MRFYKENSYDISKLFVNQIGIAIFSLILYTAVGFADDKALLNNLKLGISIFSTLFYFALLYTTAWDFGARDKIRVESGKINQVAYKGAFMSLLANVPSLILSVLASAFMGLYLLGAGDGMYSAFAAVNLFLRLLSSMFLGMLQNIFLFCESNADISFLLQSVGYIVFTLITVVITQFGYNLGSKEKRIFAFVTSQNKTK